MSSTRTVGAHGAGGPGELTASQAEQQAPRRLAAVAGVWSRHKDVLGGAGSLVASTAVTSGLGFAFWAVAARTFSQRAVGFGSAGTSAMALLGTIGMFGLGTVLIGELPGRSPRGGLVAAALLASGVGSLILGFGFAVAAPFFSHNFAGIGGTPFRVLLFAVGVMLTGVGLVFDQATIGLLRGGLQLSRNMVFTVVKLLALPATAFLLHDQFGVGIDLAWIAGIAASMLAVGVILRIGGDPILPRPDWDVLRGLGRTAMSHNWLNLAISVPWSVIPVLVTVVVSPQANAAFYAAWTLSGILYMVPTHLSTVLFAVAAGDVKATAHKLRFTLKLSVLIGLPCMAALGFGAHLALSLFGAGYARLATVPLWLLVLGYIPAIPRMHYIAVCRAANRITRAAVVLTSFSTAEIVAAAIGGKLAGLNGLTLALLIVFTIEGIVTAPMVLRTARGRGRHRTAAEQATALAAGRLAPSGDAPDGAGSTRSAERRRDMEEARLAALLSASGFVSATGPIPVVADGPGYPSGQRLSVARRLPRVVRWSPPECRAEPEGGWSPPIRRPEPEGGWFRLQLEGGSGPERWPGPEHRPDAGHYRWSPPERRAEPEGGWSPPIRRPESEGGWSWAQPQGGSRPDPGPEPEGARPRPQPQDGFRPEHRREQEPLPPAERQPHEESRDDWRDSWEDEQDRELASLRSLAAYATQTLPLPAIRDYTPPDRRDRRDAGPARRP